MDDIEGWQLRDASERLEDVAPDAALKLYRKSDNIRSPGARFPDLPFPVPQIALVYVLAQRPPGECRPILMVIAAVALILGMLVFVRQLKFSSHKKHRAKVRDCGTTDARMSLGA